MKIRLLPLLAVVALTFGLGLTGCKSKEEKACANMYKILSEDKDMPEEAKKELGLDKSESEYVEKCSADAKKDLKDCKNPDDALDCMAEAKDAEAMAKCAAKCE